MKTIYSNSKSCRLILVFLATFWFIPVFSQDGEGGWKQLKSMSTERFFGQACYLDGKIYVTGGYNALDIFQASTEVYDIVLNEWTTLANLHLPKLGGTMEIYDGKIYAIGGLNTISGDVQTDVEKYDPATDKWTVLGDTPETLWGQVSCTIDHMTFIFGGYDDLDGYALNSCLTFDLTTDNWDNITSMSHARGYPVCCLYGDKIYVFGGTQLWGPEGKTNSAEAYDPAEDSWENIEYAPEGMIAHGAISVEEDSLILILNENRMYAYYPAGDKYVQMKNIPKWCYASSVVKAGRYLYLMGGDQNGSFTPSAELWQFNLDSLQPKSSLVSLEINNAGNTLSNITQCYPNPLNKSVEISYELASRAKVRLEIYNCLGMKIKILVNEFQSPGEYTVEWNAENIKEGIYFCILDVNGYVQTKKLLKSEPNR